MTATQPATFTTANRQYTIRAMGGKEWAGNFTAFYNPINKKTGKPWQANRYLKGDSLRYGAAFTSQTKALEAIYKDAAKRGEAFID